MQRLCFFALWCSVACSTAPATPNDVTSSLTPEQKRIATVVFPDNPVVAAQCTSHVRRSYVECLLRNRLASDGDALALALRLYDEMGVVVGVDTEKVTDDGDYRGVVHIVPALPVGDDRVHLRMVLDALRRVGRVLDELSLRTGRPMTFVRAPSALRFFRTIDRTTPSAYATEGAIAYNVAGELWTSAESVEDTLVHELFHLGDEADHWSETVLVETFDRIRERCGTDATCLEPYAPFETRVDGGMYYAFHPKSDVREYGGELAIRFVREQRAWMTASYDVSRSFKCQTPENAVAWHAIADKFFGSVDLVPPCEAPGGARRVGG